MKEFSVPAGMPRSVWENKYARKLDGKGRLGNERNETGFQKWADRVSDVVQGNFLLDPRPRKVFESEMEETLLLAKAGILPFSGRHLQHGDLDQPDRIMETYTNCSTAMFSFIKFWLLLKGSGVGRCYDSDLCRVDWDFMPNTRFVLSERHPDFEDGLESLEEARHKYDSESEEVRWFEVTDSGEGWVKIIEIIETAAFQHKHQNKLFIFDFSKVRCKGTPIKGQQGRPASGPVPFIYALRKVASIKGAGMKPWKQAMYIDHYLSSCVAVGGIRRSARIATKSWKDKDVIEFIDIKRVESERAKLYTANNSITVDKEFWDQAMKPEPSHARRVFEAAVGAAYFDQTGEPGFLNVDLLTNNETGLNNVNKDNYISPEMMDMLELHDRTMEMIEHTLKWAKKKKYKFIVNPCVTEDTWVMTSKGPKQVKDLIGKKFEAVVNSKPYKASGFWRTGEKEVFRLKTSKGYEVRLTSNHKVKKLTETGEYSWVEAKDLNLGDKLVLNKHRDLVWGGEGTLEEGWLVGEVLGDGGHNPLKDYPTYVRFWGSVSSYLQEIALERVKLLGCRKDLKGFKTSLGALQVSSKALEDLCSKYMEPGKSLLDTLENTSSDFHIGFLRGLFDSDGSVQGNLEKGISIRLSQSNLTTLERVQRMLSRLGIVSTIYSRRPAKSTALPDGKGGTSHYKTKEQLELVITRESINTFYDRIGFEDFEKANKLESLMSNRKRVTYRDNWVTSVTELIPDGVESVYDCQVDKVHEFDANGISVHNCGEIVLNIMGGYCVIGDICLANADNKEDTISAARLMARFLIRVNRMTSLYKSEVERTNRIGVGLTGIHEFAYKLFGFTFWDLLDEEKSLSFWSLLAEMRRAVEASAVDFAGEVGMSIPHTFTTVKPSGTVSKVMNCTEGAHLPALAFYIRWVQYALDDPAVEDHKERGYPVKDISSQYSGHCVVGFPTKMPIADLMGDKVVTANEVSPEDQYEWLRLLEKYWLGGKGSNNQVSYTLKYDPELVTYSTFSQMILENQPTIKACSIMPSINESAYVYVPEEKITKEEYEEMISHIDRFEKEAVDSNRLDCEGGACPIEFDIN